VGRIKGLLSQNTYSRRESWITGLSLNKKGQKAASQKKIPLCFRVMLQKGVDDVSEDDDE
jgi:hypothetical protein